MALPSKSIGSSIDPPATCPTKMMSHQDDDDTDVHDDNGNDDDPSLQAGGAEVSRQSIVVF